MLRYRLLRFIRAETRPRPAARTKRLDGSTQKTRQRAYNDFLANLSRNGLLGDEDTTDFTKVDYYFVELASQMEQALITKYTDDLGEEANASSPKPTSPINIMLCWNPRKISIRPIRARLKRRSETCPTIRLWSIARRKASDLSIIFCFPFPRRRPSSFRLIPTTKALKNANFIKSAP